MAGTWVSSVITVLVQTSKTSVNVSTMVSFCRRSWSAKLTAGFAAQITGPICLKASKCIEECKPLSLAPGPWLGRAGIVFLPTKQRCVLDDVLRVSVLSNVGRLLGLLGHTSGKYSGKYLLDSPDCAHSELEVFGDFG